MSKHVRFAYTFFLHKRFRLTRWMTQAKLLFLECITIYQKCQRSKIKNTKFWKIEISLEHFFFVIVTNQQRHFFVSLIVVVHAPQNCYLALLHRHFQAYIPINICMTFFFVVVLNLIHFMVQRSILYPVVAWKIINLLLFSMEYSYFGSNKKKIDRICNLLFLLFSFVSFPDSTNILHTQIHKRSSQISTAMSYWI